jgi:DNA-binding MarR family transcriptional regulator
VAKAPKPPTPNFLFPVFVTGQLSGALLGRAIESTGLTPNEFAVLSLIAIRAPVAPSELAQTSGMPATTMSDYIARLHRRRLVRRLPNPDDGRSYLLELTDTGHTRNARAIEGLRESNRAIAAQLGAESVEVRESLLRLEDALRRALSPKS